MKLRCFIPNQRLRLDFDAPFGAKQRGDHDHRRGGADLAEDLAMDRADASASAGSVMNIRVRTTSAARPPSSLIAARMIAKQRRAWAAASPGVDVPSGSTGAVPDTMIRLPARTAREKPYAIS